jgi:hypothetical protein
MPDLETPLETPEEDAVEQQQQTVAEQSGAVSAAPKWDADEADVAESSLEVPLDDDEYR